MTNQNPITKEKLKETIAIMVKQTELFPESLNAVASDLNQAELEKLTITLHVAQTEAAKLDNVDQDQLQKSLKRYFDGKKRIYNKTQRKWLEYQEARHEQQESLFEKALLESVR